MEEDAFFLAGPGAREDDGIAPHLRLSTAPASDR